MMERVFERRTLAATLIFNLEDSYLRERLGPRAHPRPYEPLRFWLVAREAPGPREVYSAPRELVITRNPSGYHLFFGHEWLAHGSRKQRRTHHMELAPGTYRVRVTSPLYQTEEQSVVLPLPNLNARDPGNPDPALRDPLAQYTFALRPGYAYPFPDTYPIRLDDPDICPDAPPPGRRGPTLLYGSLYTPDGRGITGATVRVDGSPAMYQTDASGQWVLWFREPQANDPNPAPTGPVTVHVTMPDSSVVDVPNVCVVRGCSTSLGQAALRGWVLRQGISVGGATIAVSGQQATITSRPDGGWAYYFGLNQPDAVVSVTATLPDGASQTQNGIEVRHRATVMVPTFVFP
jgi:hypothetical protein